MWTQILTALLVGLLTAFAFQLLLTTFGVAIGLTALGFHFATPTPPVVDADLELADELSDSQEDIGRSASNVGTVAGLGILLTVNIVLFGACFLAVKFSQVDTPTSGAIAGIAIWSAYFLVLTWVSSTAVSKVVGSLLGAATGGFRQLVATIASAFQGQEDPLLDREQAIAIIQQEIEQAFSPDTFNQLIAPSLNQYLPSVQDIQQDQKATQALTQQLETLNEQLRDYSGPTSGVDQSSGQPASEGDSSPTEQSETLADSSLAEINAQIWQRLELYLRHTHPKQLVPEQVQRKLETLLEEALGDTTEQPYLLEFDRNRLKEVLKRRKGLDKKQRQRILRQIEKTWDQRVGQAEPTSSEDTQSKRSHVELPSSLQPVAAYIVESMQQLGDNLQDGEARVEAALQQKVPQEMGFASLVAYAIQQQLNQTNWETILDRLPIENLNDTQIEQVIAEVRSTAQNVLDKPQQWTEEYLLSPVESWKTQVSQQMDLFQQNVQQKIGALKLQTQQRLENTRKAAAAAAWWLFASAFTAAISAAIAGALAAGMPHPIFPAS